jgi:hypothetical protein
MRVLVATLGAAFVMGAFPSAAHATHHCAELGTDDYGIFHTAWVVCEDGPHHPVGVLGYVICWLSPTC